MLEPDNPYAVLGVAESATLEEIRAAYRRLARQHHPDVAPDAGDRMVVINRAYALLADPARREAFDTGRLAPTAPEVAGTPPVVDDAVPEWVFEHEEHLDDWRQMFEEERQRWELLLQSVAPGTPEYAALQAEVERARSAQVAFENGWRARHGLEPLAEEDLERRRAETRVRNAATGPPGCLGVLLLLLRAAPSA